MKKLSTLALAFIFALAIMPFVNAQTASTDTQKAPAKTEQKKDKKAHKKGTKKTNKKADAAK